MAAIATRNIDISPNILILPISDPNNVDLKSSLTFVLIGAVFSSLLIPMLIALVLFSTQDTRRRWLFHLNALALAFGIVQGILLSGLYVSTPHFLSAPRPLIYFSPSGP
jgi:hypothetical protein